MGRASGSAPKKMGLTIHYHLGYSGNSPEEILEKLRQKALDMPVEEVSPRIYHFKGEDAKYKPQEKNSEFSWALIQSMQYIDLGGGRSLGVPTKEVYLFSVWPGEECEEANFGLAKYPSTITHDGQKIPSKLGSAWRWRSFCKTQYASNVSAEHFLKCHVAVCSLLKEAEKFGILQRVSDEGGFWNNWDYEALVREVTQWNSAIADVVQQLEQVFDSENIVAPVKDQVAYWLRK